MHSLAYVKVGDNNHRVIFAQFCYSNEIQRRLDFILRAKRSQPKDEDRFSSHMLFVIVCDHILNAKNRLTGVSTTRANKVPNRLRLTYD